MAMRDLRSIHDSNLRAAARIAQMKHEPLLVRQEDIGHWLGDFAAKKPLAIPFPALGEAVPLAWEVKRHHYISMAQDDENRAMISKFITDLVPGHGYGIVNAGPDGTVIIAEFTRVLH